MENTRRSRPVEARAGPGSPCAGRTSRIDAAVAQALASRLPDGGIAAIALSGGRDSVVLLDAAARLAPALGVTLCAIHVHHGLSPNADAWARFCAGLCAARGLPLRVERVNVPRQGRQGLEAEARSRRYAALAASAIAAGARHVLLAHHRDDQAETLLLQLLRGAGPHGLAGMPVAVAGADGLHWLRPMLALGRNDIDAQARSLDLDWIEDESNQSSVHRRNALRLDVLPQLARVFPAWASTLARAATHQAGAAALQDDLAALDARTACADGGLIRAALAALPPYRAANLLRWFLHEHGLPPPSAARLEAMLAQLRGARPDAKLRLAHGGAELGMARGLIVLHRPPPPPFEFVWRGESELRLPHGRLGFHRTPGQGIDASRLDGADVRIRSRRGGERFQLGRRRVRRALKSILREAGVPAWERSGLPLVFCGPMLAAVAGFAVDADFLATAESPGISLEWTPDRI